MKCEVRWKRVKKKNSTVKKITGTVIFYVFLLVIWQLVFWLGTEVLDLWKEYSFPNPLGVVKSFKELLAGGTLLIGLGYSLGRGIIGFVISVILGTVFGVLLVVCPKVKDYLKPFLMGVQTLPSVCWVPFAILWFGLDEDAIIFVIVMGSTFSIALAVESAIKNVNPLLIKAARTMGAKRTVLYWKVIFPASLPSLVSGLRQGWSFAWRALMSGEVMTATVGLGYTLMMGRNLADINQVMLIMIVIILVGVIIDRAVFSNIENRMLKKRGLL